MKRIDCRNMACPLPVVTVKRALEEAGGEAVEVLLDDGPSRENVARYAANHGFVVAEKGVDGGYVLTISGGGEASSAGRGGGERPMLITSDRLGEGPEELGRLLMKNFIITLLELGEVPTRIFFVNTGIFLTTEGSEVIEALDKLGKRGVDILSCGVCLDFFNRREKLAVGAVTNMFTIAESLLTGDAVVRL